MHYIGVMSGSSLDQVDAVLVDFSQNKPQLLEQHSCAIEPDLAKKISQLLLGSFQNLQVLGECDTALGQLYAKTVRALLAKANIQEKVVAIGCHGQTILHQPEHILPFTQQIGDPSWLSLETGIDVVTDFRRANLVLGGQGAPFAPAFHKQLFAKPGRTSGY